MMCKLQLLNRCNYNNRNCFSITILLCLMHILCILYLVDVKSLVNLLLQTVDIEQFKLVCHCLCYQFLLLIFVTDSCYNNFYVF